MSHGSWMVYMIECADGTYYTGATNDLAKRLRAHNENEGAKYTKGRGPVEVKWVHRNLIRGDALSLEYRIKQLTKEQKKQLIEGEMSASDLHSIFQRNV